MFEVRGKPEMVERALLVRLSFNRREEDADISLLAELDAYLVRQYLEKLIGVMAMSCGGTLCD